MVSFSDWRSFGPVKIATTINTVHHDTGNEETRRIATITFDDVKKGAFELPAAVIRMMRTPAQIKAENEIARKRFAAHIGSYQRVSADGRPRPPASVIPDLPLSTPGLTTIATVSWTSTWPTESPEEETPMSCTAITEMALLQT